jgi:PAS domain S-box-containing protein
MTETAYVYAIVLSDEQGLIRHWSSGAEQLFGFSAAEAEGQSLDIIVPEPFRARHWQGFRKAVESGKCDSDRAATNLPVLCKDGTVRVFPARFMFLQDPRNRVIGAMGLYAIPQGTEKPFGPIVDL